MVALLALAVMGVPATGLAEPEHIRIRFEAPAGCSDQAAFLDAVAERTTQFQLAKDDEPVRVLTATVVGDGPLIAGKLEVRGPSGDPSLRSVRGQSCEEVVAALALMTALAIDPNALSSNKASARPPEAVVAKNVPPPAPAKPLPPPSLVATRTAPAPSLPWTWSVGIQGSASRGMSPTLGLGGLVFVDAESPGHSVLGLTIRSGLFVSESTLSRAGGAGARFIWGAAVVEGCPVRLVFSSGRLRFYPCLAVHVGVLRGEGQNIVEIEKSTGLWADLGPLARVRFALSQHLLLEAQGMVVLPLSRPEFTMQDPGPVESRVWAVPRSGWLFGVGVGYQFR